MKPPNLPAVLVNQRERIAVRDRHHEAGDKRRTDCHPFLEPESAFALFRARPSVRSSSKSAAALASVAKARFRSTCTGSGIERPNS